MIVATNRKAYHQYKILKEFEAGIVLKGPEVKSIRQHQIDIKHSFARVMDNEVFLMNAHISPYKEAHLIDYDPKRRKKLLLKKREIKHLEKETEQKGITLIPTKVYFKKGFAKVSIALVKGKTMWDKREALKKKDAQREIEKEKGDRHLF